LALDTIREFEGRTFRCKQVVPGQRGISGEEMQRLINEELPAYYDYSTRVTKYIDNRNKERARIEIMGSIGLRGSSGRYNPLDVKIRVKTEKAP
jgi:hypothetical protein